MADVWKMYRRRYDLYSPSRTAVNSIFIYGIPLYITMYGENLIIGEAYKKFFIEPDYVESWLVVFIAFFAVGVVSAAYRGDKRYAALYAMNCSGSLTLLFVGLAVYYRTMSIIPSSEIAGARYVLFDLAKYFHNQYYTEFLIWGYDYVTLVMCIMSSTVFTVTFYLMIDSEEAKVEWVVL
ncbi:MAG TPA: hypothetical protein VEA37_14385 [Flavobacterium sp.]|nr:hypothetical protein [Flavobacterium sp.]